MRETASACWPRKWKLPKSFRWPWKWDIRCSRAIFFAGPKCCISAPSPRSSWLTSDLLQAATADEFNIDALASKIKHEPSLTFKLLRYLNSAAFGLRTEIHSIHHALTLLGERELRKWIAVVSVGVHGGRKTR